MRRVPRHEDSTLAILVSLATGVREPRQPAGLAHRNFLTHRAANAVAQLFECHRCVAIEIGRVRFARDHSRIAAIKGREWRATVSPCRRTASTFRKLDVAQTEQSSGPRTRKSNPG